MIKDEELKLLKRNLIKTIIDRIDNLDSLKRIYRLVEYLYINKEEEDN